MKNPPGYGSIVDLGKGRRRPIAVRVPSGKKFNKQGKEIIQYRYLGYFDRTRQGKQEAQILLANYNAGVNVDVIPTSRVCPTFKVLSEQWLERHLENVRLKKGSVSHQLEMSYLASIKRCASIHNIPVDKISFQDVQRIADSVRSKSDSTVNNLKVVLSEVFDVARKQGYIRQSFIPDIEFYYKKKTESIHSSFSREEVARLWEETYDKSVQLILIMIYTGLRIEEFLRMKRCDVNLKERYMTGGIKTAAGKERMIPIADKIYPFVEDCYNSGSVYLIEDRKDHRYSRRIFVYNLWDPAMKRLSMEHLPHDTRYTCASMLDRAGVNENTKRTILGHEKEGVTNKVYVQKDLQDLLEAINMI